LNGIEKLMAGFKIQIWIVCQRDKANDRSSVASPERDHGNNDEPPKKERKKERKKEKELHTAVPVNASASICFEYLVKFHPSDDPRWPLIICDLP
jgi:hypothetical protein